MVRKYTGSKASVKTAEALAREGLKQEEKSEKAMEAQKKAGGSVSVLSVQWSSAKSKGCGGCC